MINYNFTVYTIVHFCGCTRYLPVWRQLWVYTTLEIVVSGYALWRAVSTVLNFTVSHNDSLHNSTFLWVYQISRFWTQLWVYTTLEIVVSGYALDYQSTVLNFTVLHNELISQFTQQYIFVGVPDISLFGGSYGCIPPLRQQSQAMPSTIIWRAVYAHNLPPNREISITKY